MIHYVTSADASWNEIKAVADWLADSCVCLEQPTRMNHRDESNWGDMILAAHEEHGTVVVAALSELALLRLLRHVGQGRIASDQIKTHWVSPTVFPTVIGVTPEGELAERVPGGFFDGRMADLFY